ncbi:hypothetical protein M8C21_029307 [Ambrosia artemisiifolia]|uniref:Uncharacterized protein n=1 Tax=Ambrosia artemisiifolia TaxID=4212 RepID=A0AAD5DBB4_AMBAR|nr:hypothetical protein M8C21_029307 [Ambrosia artemisiifolia]
MMGSASEGEVFAGEGEGEVCSGGEGGSEVEVEVEVEVRWGWIVVVRQWWGKIKRSVFCLRLGLVTLHIILVGFLFIFVEEFRDNTKEQPWYTLIYLLLVVATLVQYYFTSGSSPGYVIDAMREYASTEASLRASEISNAVVTIEGNQLGQNLLGNNPINWTNLVMDMYPPGASVSLQGQSIAMIVTDVFFSLITIVFGWEHASAKATTVDFGGTFLSKLPYVVGLAFCISKTYQLIVKGHVLTNQTTYEVLRRRRIPYMRQV